MCRFLRLLLTTATAGSSLVSARSRCIKLSDGSASKPGAVAGRGAIARAAGSYMPGRARPFAVVSARPAAREHMPTAKQRKRSGAGRTPHAVPPTRCPENTFFLFGRNLPVHEYVTIWLSRLWNARNLPPGCRATAGMECIAGSATTCAPPEGGLSARWA